MDSEILAVNPSRALVVYGTRWGGTIKVAEKIGEILRGEGYLVDIFDAKGSPQVDPCARGGDIGSRAQSTLYIDW